MIDVAMPIITDWYPVMLSLRVALIALVGVTCFGLPLSRLFARREFFGKDIAEAAIQLFGHLLG